MFSRFIKLVLETLLQFLGKKVEEKEKEREITQNMLLWKDEADLRVKQASMTDEEVRDITNTRINRLRSRRK